MITSEREDWLTTQYVWGLQNNSEWFKRASENVRNVHFGSFSIACEIYTMQVLRTLRKDGYTQESLTLGERAYITLLLWQQADGNMDNKSDQFRRFQMLLKEELEGSNCELTGVMPEHEQLQQEIQQHQENAAAHFAQVEAELNRIEQEKQMNQANQTAFQTKSYVYGMDVSSMNEAQLIDAIKSVEAEIANLGQVKTASKKIDAKKAELTAMLANIVEILDAK